MGITKRSNAKSFFLYEHMPNPDTKNFISKKKSEKY